MTRAGTGSGGPGPGTDSALRRAPDWVRWSSPSKGSFAGREPSQRIVHPHFQIALGPGPSKTGHPTIPKGAPPTQKDVTFWMDHGPKALKNEKPRRRLMRVIGVLRIGLLRGMQLQSVSVRP